MGCQGAAPPLFCLAFSAEEDVDEKLASVRPSGRCLSRGSIMTNFARLLASDPRNVVKAQDARCIPVNLLATYFCTLSSSPLVRRFSRRRGRKMATRTFPERKPPVEQRTEASFCSVPSRSLAPLPPPPSLPNNTGEVIETGLEHT